MTDAGAGSDQTPKAVAGDSTLRGRPRSLPLAERVLVVAVY
jgi:hypothetical protein